MFFIVGETSLTSTGLALNLNWKYTLWECVCLFLFCFFGDKTFHISTWLHLEQLFLCTIVCQSFTHHAYSRMLVFNKAGNFL